jgi:hypothetical protein
MSVLPGGQPLDRVLPDLDDLLTDPHAYLSEASLAIGSRRMYKLAGLFALPGAALLLSCVIEGKPDPERLVMGIGFLLGASVWLFWTLMLRGHELVLHPDGIEVIYRGTIIWAPWALFHVEGRPFVPQSDSPGAGLILPIDPKMVPHVQLRSDGMAIAWGRAVSGPQWYFTGSDEIVLPARYEIQAQDIGELLLVLGHRLGETAPKTTPPPEAEIVPDHTIPALDPSGWMTLPLTRLQLPPCCARCGGPRDDTLRVQVLARGDWVLGILIGGPRAIELPVPVCEPCKEFINQKQRNGGSLGLAVGAALGTAVGVGLGVWLGEGRDLALLLGLFFGFFLGSFTGSMLGLTMSRKLPIRLRNYSPSRGLVSVRFENPLIAAQVLEAMRQREASTSEKDSL